MAATTNTTDKAAQSRKSWKNYTPLITMALLAVLAALAKQAHYGAWHPAAWMHDFMGVFLLIFSMLKLFDLSGFADGFQKYDLLAKRSRCYAYVYPFLELAIALGYLSFWQPTLIYGATVALMSFGALGVLSALRRGLDVQCACMGTILRVPLSTVALVEDLGMSAMALVMLLVR